MTVLKKLYAAVVALYKAEPARITGLVVSAIIAVFGLLHIVVGPEAVAAVLPVLLGSEAVRTQVTPK
jgi:sorbitol-specific phosphotransferase system component IIBC